MIALMRLSTSTECSKLVSCETCAGQRPRLHGQPDYNMITGKCCYWNFETSACVEQNLYRNPGECYTKNASECQRLQTQHLLRHPSIPDDPLQNPSSIGYFVHSKLKKNDTQRQLPTVLWTIITEFTGPLAHFVSFQRADDQRCPHFMNYNFSQWKVHIIRGKELAGIHRYHFEKIGLYCRLQERETGKYVKIDKDGELMTVGDYDGVLTILKVVLEVDPETNRIKTIAFESGIWDLLWCGPQYSVPALFRWFIRKAGSHQPHLTVNELINLAHANNKTVPNWDKID